MNKKKYIIALVLLVFIGLTVFTFANSNEELEGNETPVVEENKNKDDSKEENNTTINSQSVTEGTLATTKIDEAYQLALKAVLEAEDKIDEETYNRALDLVGKVTDTDTTELEERLEKVKNTFVKELVDTLNEMTTTATDKEEMEEARDFRITKDIINKVESLEDEEVKEELKEILTTLAKLLNDNQAPTVNIEDGAILANDQEIEGADENPFVMYLTKDDSTDSDEISNGHQVSDGIYTLSLTDSAFNNKTITFTIDTVYPEITKVPNGQIVNYSVSPKVEDENLKTVVLTKNGSEIVNYQDNMYELSHDGSYVLTGCDIANNCTTVSFIIDKTLPVFDGIKNGIYYQNDITVNVIDDNLDKIEAVVYAEQYKTIELNNGEVLSQESIYKLTATDKAGNSAFIYVAVDKTNPIFTTVKNGHQYTGEITVNVEDLKIKTIELYSYNDKTTKLVENGYVITEDGTYAITATDHSGRTTKVYVELDNQGPTISGLDVDYASENKIVTVTDKNLKTVTINGVKQQHDGKTFIHEFTEDGKYVVVATDRAGNSSTDEVVIDKTAPTFDGIKNGIYYQNDITVNVIDDNLDKIEAVVYAEQYKTIELNNGEVLSQESIYKLTATDKAGNSAFIYVAVDKTNPIFTTVKNGHQYTGEITVNVEDLKIKRIELYSYNDKTTKLVENGYVITEDGTYAITATDHSGRTTKVYVELDNQGPTISGLDVAYTSKNEIVTVTDKNLKTVTINGVEQQHDEKTFTDKFTHEGKYVVVATDKAGNSSTDEVVIDKTAPIFTTVKNGHKYNEITINVQDLSLKSIQLFSYNDGTTKEIENGYQITEDGTYAVTATDHVGKSTKVYVTLDTEKPVLTSEGFVEFTVNPDGEADMLLGQKIISDEEVKVLNEGLGFEEGFAKEFTVSYYYNYNIDKMTGGSYHTINVVDKAGNVQSIDNIWIPTYSE